MMSKKAKVFKYIGYTLLSLFSVLLVTILLLIACRPLMYDDFYKNAKKDVKIPVAEDSFCPQGLAYDDENNTYLFSGYMTNNTSSRIYVTAGETTKYVRLINEDDTPFLGHIGGVTIHGDKVYLSDDKTVIVLNYQDILQAGNNSTLKITTKVDVNNEASFVFDSPTHLYVGEFYMKGRYETAKENWHEKNGNTYHAIVEAFPFDTSEVGFNSTPDYTISIPDKVQGMCVTDSGKIAISISYAIVNSKLMIYEDVTSTQESEDNHYFLDVESRITNIAIPPMSEDLDYHDGNIYINFESACDKYVYFNIYPTYNVYKYKIN